MLMLDNTVALGAISSPGTSANAVDSYVSYVDLVGSAPYTITPAQSNAASVTSSQTTIVSAPASGTQRRVKFLSIFNRDVVPQTVTVYLDTLAAAAGPTDETAKYDSNDGSNTIATGYSQLTDLSGNGRHLTQGTGANQPTQVSDTVNGVTKNVMNFDGTAQVLTSAADISTFVTSTAWTVIAETKPTRVPLGTNTLFINQSDAVIGDSVDELFQGIVYRKNTLTSQNEVGSGSINTAATEGDAWTTGYQINAWNTCVGRMDSTSATISIQLNSNPPVKNQCKTPGLINAAVLNLGKSQTSATSFFGGRVGRVRIWNRALTGLEIANTLAEFKGWNTVRNLYQVVLQPNEMLQYTDDEGWTTIDAAGNRKNAVIVGASSMRYFEIGAPMSRTGMQQGTVFLQRGYLPQAFAPDVAYFALAITGSANQSNTVSIMLGAYAFSSQSLLLKASALRSIVIGTADVSQSLSAASGTKQWSMPIQSWALTPGEYVFAWAMTVSTSGTSGTYSYFVNRSTISNNGSEFGAGTGNLTSPILFGVYSAATSVFPPTIAWSEVNQTGAFANYGAQPWFALIKSGQTTPP